ncbi:putative membrane protein SirB2 [Rossellomorea marisflavi]
MYFILISSFLLFSLLTGYTGYQGEWVYCAIFGVFSIIILGATVRRYRSQSKRTSKKDSTYWDCVDCAYLGDCVPVPRGIGKHVGGGDCCGFDCTP